MTSDHGGWMNASLPFLLPVSKCRASYSSILSFSAFIESRLSETLASVERDYILQVLEETKWKVSGANSASEILGLDRSTLRARMAKLNIEKS